MQNLKWVALGIVALIIIVFIMQGSQQETHIGRTDHPLSSELFVSSTPEATESY